MLQPARKFELTLLSSLPAGITCILAIIYLSARHLNGLNQFMPLIPLIPVFYWGMMQAREMPYWFVFALGLVMDAVMGLPLGLSSFLNVLFLALLRVQRKYVHKEGFVIKWGYFAALLAVIASLNWIILSLFSATSLNLLPAFLQWLLTVCFYPAMHKWFSGIYEHTHSRRWQILHGH